MGSAIAVKQCLASYCRLAFGARVVITSPPDPPSSDTQPIVPGCDLGGAGADLHGASWMRGCIRAVTVAVALAVAAAAGP